MPATDSIVGASDNRGCSVLVSSVLVPIFTFEHRPTTFSPSSHETSPKRAFTRASLLHRAKEQKGSGPGLNRGPRPPKDRVIPLHHQSLLLHKFCTSYITIWQNHNPPVILNSSHLLCSTYLSPERGRPLSLPLAGPFLMNETPREAGVITTRARLIGCSPSSRRLFSGVVAPRSAPERDPPCRPTTPPIHPFTPQLLSTSSRP